MRTIAILLFIVTCAAGIYAFRSKAAVHEARASERTMMLTQRHLRIPPGVGPHHLGSPSAERPLPPEVVGDATDAHTATKTAEQAAAPATYIQIALTAILVPFSIFLVLKRSKDTAANTFSFTSLGIVIAYWLHQ